MKIGIVILTIIGLVTTKSLPKYQLKISDKNFLTKQKFLLEIVYRIEDPLMFDEYIKFGQSFKFNRDDYTHFDMYMEKFYAAYKHDSLLAKGEIFDVFVQIYQKQTYGLFGFFNYAKSWEVFQNISSWARLYCNEVMFVDSLISAVSQRKDFNGLVLPSIYEIFPQKFFNSKFVKEAGKFDYANWSKNFIYEKLFNDTLLQDNSNNEDDSNSYYFYSKDFKTHQWWKLMGLDQRWYSEDHLILRENFENYYKNPKFLEIFNSTKIVFMPVDYSRDTVFGNNKESALSYYTEDVGMKAFWYNFNMEYTFSLNDIANNSLTKDRDEQYRLYNIRQLLTRRNMERLSHGYSAIPEKIEYSINSFLEKFYEDFKLNDFEDFSNIFLNYETMMRDPIFYTSFKKVAATFYSINEELLLPDISKQQSFTDVLDKYLFKFDPINFAYSTTYDFEDFHEIFINYQTMFRDPMFYISYKKIAQIYNKFFSNIKLNNHEEVLFPVVGKKSDIEKFFKFFQKIITTGNIQDLKMFPNLFLNYETLLRDPMFYISFKKIASVYNQYSHYNLEQLLFPVHSSFFDLEQQHNNIDIFKKFVSRFTSFVADTNHDLKSFPSLFLNYETLLRDPIFYTSYKKIASVHNQYSHYNLEQLLFPDIGIEDNFETFDKLFFKFKTVLDFVDVEFQDFLSNIFLNYETMLRDPMFYISYKKVAYIFYEFYNNIKPYTHKELVYPGVLIKNVSVSELVTYFDLIDFDVTNLSNDMMTFVDDKFVWNLKLLARQMRQNHEPFEFNFTIESNKSQNVIIRTFLAPQYDEFGRVITLKENRPNFMELDSFIQNLTIGMNTFQRSSKDFYWTVKDRVSYTELYKYVLLALEDKYDFPLNITQPHCGFPDRLVLPRGWFKGMPMKLFFHVTPFNVSTNKFVNYTCGFGSGVPYPDDMPFGYPFDREINEDEFFGPNMYFKNVKIYHKDTFEKYYEHKYENFGQFDYKYNN
ncbi:arylphorin subunit A4-like [Cochliomyia hominivorax]